MANLEGVLTLVTSTGPWFRIQGRHLRETGASPVGVRVAMDPSSGVTVDLHVGSAVWIRAGWFPTHRVECRTAPEHVVSGGLHRCWARWLSPRVFSRGMA